LLQKSFTWIFGYCRLKSESAGSTWRTANAGTAVTFTRPAGSACVRVTREIDQGHEILELDLPAVVTADLRLNEPRYVRLPQLLKAKKMPIETLDAGALGVRPERQFEPRGMSSPPARAGGRRVSSVGDLIAALADRKLV